MKCIEIKVDSSYNYSRMRKVDMKILKTIKMHMLYVCERVDRKLCLSLPGPIRFWWSKLWIRKDEFHPSLNSHAEYATTLSSKKRDAYWHNLMVRRSIAHERDLTTT